MGEHKLREAGNGDGEKPELLSSHIVEIVGAPIWGDKCHETIARLIEDAYMKLGKRAAEENSLILGVVQAISTYVTDGQRAFALITLTAQRVSKEDFERQQRMAQFGAGGPRR